MLKCNSFRNKFLLKIMILRSHTNLINKNFKIKNVKIKTKPIIRYYFLSKQEKYDKIKVFNIIIKNFKNQ
jgi:hypothetical protein|tara:strand:+ start:364 stop:573 length:210 start_codon:yes stop_codon:yes gene_type:complete